MSAFYLTLIAVLLSGLAARDQVTLAGLTAQQGQRPGLLVTGLALSVLTAAFAGWAASAILPVLPPPARAVMGAIVIGFAGVESLVIAPRYRAKEPTHSLGATAIVLLAHQLTDAARFVIFGIAVAMNAPVPAVVGGALGGAALVAGAWAMPELVLSSRARLVRRGIGVLLLLVALYTGMVALGMV